MQKRAALINLALSLIFMFGAAFSCGQNNSNRGPSGTLTKSIVEREVRARFESPVEGGHEAWGVRIQSIELENPRDWQYGDGGGGHPGQMMYPAKVRFTQRKYHPEGTEVWEINKVLHCVMNDGRWNCENGGEMPNTQERLPDEPPNAKP